MATIGAFTPSAGRLSPRFYPNADLDTPAQLELVKSDRIGTPAYRLCAGEIELGAAWTKTTKESGCAYRQIRLNDPSFPTPIVANLIEDADAGIISLI